MKLFRRSKTNWKYVLIIVIVAVLVGGVLFWQFCLKEKITSPDEEKKVLRGDVEGFITWAEKMILRPQRQIISGL